MDIYLLVKVLHVISVIVWVGGDFACLVMSLRCERQGDAVGFARLLPHIMFITQFVAIPASLTAVLCGIIMVTLAWSFTQLWVLIGLLGFATVFISGVGFLRPRTEQLMAATDEDMGTPELALRMTEILRFVKLDHLVMFLVVADMVLKPDFTDYQIWSALLVVLIGGTALITLLPGRSLHPVSGS